jgi:autotransporter translocation and assembly factor TamB
MDVSAELAARLDGTAAAVADLEGTIGSPIATGTFEAMGLRWGATGPGEARATFSATPSMVTLDSLDASMAANTVAGRATFNLDARTLRGSVVADLRRLDALAAELPASLKAEGSLRAEAQLSGAFDNPTVAAELSSDGVRLAGQTVTALRGRMNMAEGIVNIEALDIAQDAGRLTSSGRYVLSSGRFEVDVAGNDLTIAPVPGSAPDETLVPVDAAFDLRLKGSGTLDAPRADGSLEFSRLAVEGYRIGPARVDLGAADGTARVSARVPELNASLKAELEISEPRSFTADFVLASTSLARLADPGASEALAGQSPLAAQVRGAVSLRLEASGSLKDLEDSSATLNVSLEDASVNGAPLRLVRPAVLYYSKNAVAAEPFELRVGDLALSARGGLGIDDTAGDGLQIRLAGPLSDLVPLARLAPALDEFAASGAVDVTANASGSFKAPRLDAQFSVSSASASHGAFPPVTGVTLQGDYTDGLLQLRELRARWQDSTIIASGQMPAAIIGDGLPDFYRKTLPDTAGRMSANLRIDSLTQNALAPFVSEEVVKQIAARFDIVATVEGDSLDVEGVEGGITLERAELTLAGVRWWCWRWWATCSTRTGGSRWRRSSASRWWRGR